MKKKQQTKNMLKARLTERLAALILICKGYKIISFNQQFVGVEVDILAQKKDTLVIVEIKYRQEPELQTDAIHFEQYKRLQRVLEYLASRKNLPVRLDFILFSPAPPFVQHFKDLDSW